MGVDVAQDLALQILALEGAFLNERGVVHGFRKRAGKGEPALTWRRAEAELALCPLGICQHLAHDALGARARVEDGDVVAVEDEARRPAAADDPGADDGAARAHAGPCAPRSFSLRRTSAGPRTRAFMAPRMVTARSTSLPF